MKNKIIWFFFSVTILTTLVFFVVEDKTDEQVQAELSKFNQFAENVRLATKINKVDSETETTQENKSNPTKNNTLKVADIKLPKVNPSLSNHGKYISNKWVNDIKRVTGVEDNAIDVELTKLVKNKIASEEGLDSQLIALVNEQGASVALITSDDSTLDEAQLNNKNLIKEAVEQILTDKQRARNALENGLKSILSQGQYSALEGDIQSKINDAAVNYVSKFEGRLNTYVTDLNDFQRSELTRVFDEFRKKEITGVSIGAMINSKGGTHLLSDDPASIQFIASLQQNVQSQLSSHQLASFMNGVRSEINSAELEFHSN